MKSDQTNFDKTFSHHTAKVNGVKIHYVTGGAGEPLVLLHGFPTTWQEWKPVMPALAKKYTLIVPDLRGLGDSEITAGGYDSLTTAEDIRALVKSLGYTGGVNVAAHDIAGSAAYAYAATYPAEVKRLVIIDGLPAGINPPVVPGTEQKSYWHLGFQSIPDFPEIIVAGKERAYFNYFFKTYAFNQAAVTEAEIDEYARAYARPGRLRAVFNYYRAQAADGKAHRELAKTKLSMPVLALGGETVGGDAILLAMQTAATNVSGGSIPKSGHWVMSEQPAELTRRMLEFLESK